MTKASTTNPYRLLITLVLLLSAASLAAAQARDPRIVSAQAGGVNFVSGQVTLERAGFANTLALAATDELRADDVVKTGADGRVEVLLNPGSYLRVGANAEFALTDPSLDNLTIKLTRGSAIVEAIGFDDSQFIIIVNTPRGRVALNRAGIYRFNVDANGASEVAVYKGRATVVETGLTVKGGQVAQLGQNVAVTVAKLDKNNKDALDIWSRARAEELAQINSQLTHNTTALNTLVSWNGWDTFDSPWSNSLNGFWYYGGWGCYIYVPFLGYYATSPYGFNYHCRYWRPGWRRCQSCPAMAQSDMNVYYDDKPAAENRKAVNPAKYGGVNSEPTAHGNPVSKYPGGGAGSHEKFPQSNGSDATPVTHSSNSEPSRSYEPSRSSEPSSSSEPSRSAEPSHSSSSESHSSPPPANNDAPHGNKPPR